MALPSMDQVMVPLTQCIQCMSWSCNRQQLALAVGCDIEIWTTKDGNSNQQGGVEANAWKRCAILRGHTQPISGLDWNQAEGLLVSCAHDCTAYVWKYDASTSSSPINTGHPGAAVLGAPGWIRELIDTRCSRSCLCVSWSPLSKRKAAIGSARRTIAVTSYDDKQGWWTTLSITMSAKCGVSCVAWHPTTHILAAGGTDGCVYLYNATYPNDMPCQGMINNDGFGVMLAAIDPSMGCSSPAGWLHGLTWASGGDQLLFSSHNSQLHICNLEQALAAQVTRGSEKRTANQVMLPRLLNLVSKCPDQGAGDQLLRAELPGWAAGPYSMQPNQTLQLPGCPLKTLATLCHDLVVGGGWDGYLLVFHRNSPQLVTNQYLAKNGCQRYGQWALKYALGRFMPGEQPIMSPDFLTPDSVGPRDAGRPARGTPMSSQKQSISEGGLQGYQPTDLAVWEEVLHRTVPAHSNCIVSLQPMQAARPPKQSQQQSDTTQLPGMQADQRRFSPAMSTSVSGRDSLRKPESQGGLSWNAAAVSSAPGWGPLNYEGVLRISSAGMDGRIVNWQLLM